MKNKQPRWLSTGYLKAVPGEVNYENGIIEKVSVCTEGEAKGHGVNLDSEFIETVVNFGNSRKQGVKARFGHPNMCSTALGTFLGRFKNFRQEAIESDDGQKARAVADLFLSNEAKETPHGNLYQYVLNMAANEPDMFGTSIVFTSGREYRRTDNGKKVYREWRRGEDGEDLRNNDGSIAMRWVDEQGKEVDAQKENIIQRDYIECKELHACDAVDDPAANDGLFSRFSQETIAGQITEFLDLHPQVWDALNGNDAVLDAISRYGEKVSEFVRRYEQYNIGEKTMTTEKSAHSDEVEAQGLEQANISAESVKETVASEVVEVTATEEAADGQAVETEVKTETEPEETDREFKTSEFKSLVDKFGSEIATKVILEGGTELDAYKFKAEEAEKKASELATLLKAAESKTAGNPAKFSETNHEGPVSVFRSQRKQS